MKSHWDKVYRNSDVDKLGWYEESPEPSLQLIRLCNLSSEAVILNIGAGATTLVDELLKLGYNKLVANDLSLSALDLIKKRVGTDNSSVQWIVEDLTNPKELLTIAPVDLWHDRAVLHFFTHPEDQTKYFTLLNRVVKTGGFVIIATFNLSGAERCSGLPIHRYNSSMLQEKLGEDFSLIKTFDYTYTMPSGDTREYIYTLFKREKKV